MPQLCTQCGAELTEKRVSLSVTLIACRRCGSTFNARREPQTQPESGNVTVKEVNDPRRSAPVPNVQVKPE